MNLIDWAEARKNLAAWAKANALALAVGFAVGALVL